MLQDLERQDNAHASFSKEEAPEQVFSHKQADETAAEDGSGERMTELTQATQETITVQDATVGQEVEDSHAVEPPVPTFDRTNKEPVQVEAATIPSSDPTASDALPAQAEVVTALSPTPAPSNAIPVTLNQPTQRFEDHRVVRPGGLLTSKYAEVLTARVAPLSDSTSSHSSFAAHRKSAKRQLVEDENEDPAVQIDERSAKRMCTMHIRESTGDLSTPIRRSYPSPWDRYEWALINDNMRDGLGPAMDSDREETPARTILNPDIMDNDPVIKQEPDKFRINLPASLDSVPLASAQSILPATSQPPTGPSAARRTTLQAQILAPEHVDLFRLCIPRSARNKNPHPVSEDELNLLRDLQRRAKRILRGEKDRVDIRSRIPAWMRNGLSEEQKSGISRMQSKINAMQQTIKASQPGNKGRDVKAKGANGPTVWPKPAPMKDTPAPIMQKHEWASFTVAPTPSQIQALAPPQALPPFGLEPLDYDNLFGPALVHSALKQVNNILEMLEADAQCVLSGLDLVNLQKSTGSVLPPLPPGCVSFSLTNQPYSGLARPFLVSHALQEINEMMRSFGRPQQFVLCWKDLQQMQR